MMNEDNDAGRVPLAPGSTRSAPEAPTGLRPSGDDPSRERFVGWIADRFQKRSFVPLERETALSDAKACLEGFEDMEGIQFGDPDYSWGEDDAHDFADEEIHSGWEAMP